MCETKEKIERTKEIIERARSVARNSTYGIPKVKDTVTDTTENIIRKKLVEYIDQYPDNDISEFKTSMMLEEETILPIFGDIIKSETNIVNDEASLVAAMNAKISGAMFFNDDVNLIMYTYCQYSFLPDFYIDPSYMDHVVEIVMNLFEKFDNDELDIIEFNKLIILLDLLNILSVDMFQEDEITIKVLSEGGEEGTCNRKELLDILQEYKRADDDNSKNLNGYGLFIVINTTYEELPPIYKIPIDTIYCDMDDSTRTMTLILKTIDMINELSYDEEDDENE